MGSLFELFVVTGDLLWSVIKASQIYHGDIKDGRS